jgi:hypothetical protein
MNLGSYYSSAGWIILGLLMWLIGAALMVYLPDLTAIGVVLVLFAKIFLIIGIILFVVHIVRQLTGRL